MESNPYTSPDGARLGGGVPYVSAAQASALLRSGLAIASELIGNAFEAICREVKESLSARWDFDVGSPLVQRLLAYKQSDLRAAFLARLKERQDAALDLVLARAAPPPPAVLSLSAETLSLVDAVTTTTSTVVERTAGKMQGIVEEPLRDLHVIVSYLASRPNLRTADNPYGPAVFMHALLSAGEDLALPREAWDFFLSAFEKPMAEEIGRIHLQLLQHFARHGLDAKAIRRELAARQAAARGSTASGRPSGAAGTGSAARPPTVGLGGAPVPEGSIPSLSAASQSAGGGIGAPHADPTLVLNDLLARLQANARDHRPPPLPSPGPAGAPLLEAINELQQLGLEGFYGAAFAGGAAGSINAWREHLIQKSARTVDKLTIELVGMMFDHVLRDGQVPAEIKALLSRLQFPVLKAALLDADFFASSTHPARRLIDRIASTAIGWEPYGDENQRYREEVERIVRAVLEKFDKDVSIFEKLLAEFENFVGEVAPRDNDPVARAKRALEEAEKREVLAINTTIQVRRAFEKVELEPYLRDFLVGPWVQVLVTATLRDAQTPGYSKQFREAIHELVWSVQPKATAEERKRLVTLIPNLTRVLRDGLALIRMSERDQQQFFQQLMASHAVAVKPVDQATYIKSSLATSELRSHIDGMQLTGTFPITTVAGGIKVSTGAVKRAAEEYNADVTMVEPVTDIEDLDRVEEARLDEAITSWQRGNWFSLWDGSKMVKARLRWISPLKTLFMFSSEPDGKAHVMPPDVIKSYLKKGYLKPLESKPLTKRAVDGVVSEFERMPKRAEELAQRYMVTA
ncbi:MAG: DUF1631 family protein [Sutterellaceae bacterium]|nr:DUF1631 domain-containing protein [Burkholderiaceae bacterium]MCX7900760.1 DUF1631 domain-containing protein [Burkholderiaceae bacterium]MDW8430399.1 DUF1631 family protein [Sutterellaceae bacterium]